jgi:hypothetical protein
VLLEFDQRPASHDSPHGMLSSAVLAIGRSRP